MSRFLRFVWAGLFQHGQTGALWPSQRFLIDTMLTPISPGYRGQVIELGAGSGALTFRLASKCLAARVLACEINPVLARDLRAHLGASGLAERVQVVSEPAEHLLSRLFANPAEPVDYIVSGVPLGNLGGERARALISAIHGSLRPAGMYIQFQHSLLDRKKIRDRFPRLRTIPVLLNFPPAFVYFASH